MANLKSWYSLNGKEGYFGRFHLIADNGENSIWKNTLHEGNWEPACENSAHGTVVEDSTSGLMLEGWVLRVMFCKRDWQPSCKVLLQKACLPQDNDFAGCGSTDGWQTLLTAGWHALAWEDFVWSLLSPASTESTGADKSHSTSPSNRVSAPLMGKLCTQREDVAESHRGRITLQRRKDSQLGLIHQVIYIKISMKLFDLVQRSIPV